MFLWAQHLGPLAYKLGVEIRHSGETSTLYGTGRKSGATPTFFLFFFSLALIKGGREGICVFLYIYIYIKKALVLIVDVITIFEERERMYANQLFFPSPTDCA